MTAFFERLADVFHPHNPIFVLLSAFLATFASYVSLELAGRIQVSSGRLRWMWLALSAVAMGGGIWSMHFVAMLGVILPYPVSYDTSLTFISLATAIGFAAVGLYIVFSYRQSWERLIVSGTLMGFGVAGMHYTGMAAIQIPTVTDYDRGLAVASLLVAIVASTAALWLAMNLRRRIAKVGSAFVMGAAIFGMHFTGMAAFICGPTVDAETEVASFLAALLSSKSFRPGEALIGFFGDEVALSVVIASILILLVGLGLAYYDQIARRISRTTLQEFALSAIGGETFAAASERAVKAICNVIHSDVGIVESIDLDTNRIRRFISANGRSSRATTFDAGDSGSRPILNVTQETSASVRLGMSERATRLDLGDSLSPAWTDMSGGIMVPSFKSQNTVIVIGAFSVENREFSAADEEFLRSMATMLALLNSRERATAELGLREQALEAITQGITISDVRGVHEVTTYANPAFAKMLGYTVEEIVGKSPRIFFAAKDETVLGEQIALAHAKKQILRVEVPLQRKDGSVFIDEAYGSPILDENGDYAHTVVVHGDLTEIRAREEKIRDLHRLETVGQLTGGIAHEFNNLLAVITTNAEDLRDYLQASPDYAEQADMVLQASNRGAELVQHLLAFSRKRELKPQVTDINVQIGALERLLRGTLPENIAIESLLAPNLPAVHLDPRMLSTAMLNLALNASDAMPGGGKITIETSIWVLDEEHAQQHSDLQPGRYVLISVSDTGAGMTERIAKRAFEPFFTTKEVGKGTGLGLSMVYGFVKQSGGQVKIYSEPSVGTTVTSYFPAAQADANDALSEPISVVPRAA